ncbi:hypothetical protein PV10_02416 [Exophiala mesophila]|uniref:Uncharacterized protein n=1 Tax=Exophiala mesophila TaxID=212818 RepID=A0A0D1ZJ80_EXOME|nr:uncharacterized protein PV10_02416 [Exophiala mesophila]KIV94672.1 hypothetical protein PV10_02416 [Exophiala mesophila]
MSSTILPNGSLATDTSHEKSLLTLPTFTSVHADSRTSLSTSNSDISAPKTRPGNRHRHVESENLLMGTTTGSGSESKEKNKSKDKEKEKDKRRDRDGDSHRGGDLYSPKVRRSGGFLLDSFSRSRRLSPNSLASSSSQTKANRRSESQELVVPKKPHDHHGIPITTFRSSPLASHIEQNHGHHDPATVTPPQSSTASDLRRSMSSSYKVGRQGASSASSSRKNEPRPSSTHNVGRHDDPAQIVNMALTLSEGRRRLASGRRYASNDPAEHRVISTGTTNHDARATLRTSSLAPFLAANRQSSRNRSPKPSFTPSYVDPGHESPLPSVQGQDTPRPETNQGDSTMSDSISPATLSRVEKAKVYFELAHEHRRLLPHLPPIRRPSTNFMPHRPELMQRAYNPLQYVRNRKLRVWEKTPIHSELDGWYDVNQVRAWIDAVISSNAKTHHEPDECLRLPPLDQRAETSDGDDPDESPDEMKKAASPRLPDHILPKLSRPRSDWVTHPADLLADAYWLEQGLNKLKIQDRDNNVIYPPDTHFQFSGWRNKTPVDLPTTMQQPSPPQSPEEHHADEPPSALPELPTFKSAYHPNSHAHAGRHKAKLKDALLVKDASSSRERSRIKSRLFRDSSESGLTDSSPGSDDGNAQERGRKRLRRKRRQSHDQGSQSPGKHTSGSRNQDKTASVRDHTDELRPTSPTSNRSSFDHSAFSKSPFKDSLKRISPIPKSRRAQSARPGSALFVTRSSLDNERGPRHSADYYDTTAPTSPAAVEWPSIAINLSPPPSRGPSPVRKARPSLLHPFQRTHKDHDTTSVTDFAANSHPHHQQPKRSSDSPAVDSGATSPDSRGMSPFSKNRSSITRPEDDHALQTDEHGLTSTAKTGTRVTHLPPAPSEHSRLRGIFKGGRIAELVGNEVTRVGDFIWKRDLPHGYTHGHSASDGSIRSYPGSDSAIDPQHNGSLLKTPPALTGRSRSSTISSTKSELLSSAGTKVGSPSVERPKYNNPNLPSFTSPFQKDREVQEKKQSLLAPSTTARIDSSDHITALGGNERPPSRSPGLRLGLPRLDTSTGESSGAHERRKSYGFGQALDMSRSLQASDYLNAAINPINGRAGPKSTKSASELGQEDQSEHEADEPGAVSWRDIGRAEALLFSQTVKAREIGFRAEDPDTHAPKFLLDSFTPENRTLYAQEPFRIKRREHHVVAAKNIMETLDRHTSTINYKLHSFSAVIAPSLHKQLQTLEDKVENTLTPQVRLTADATGELSINLTTASTLAVKGLNDSIEAAFRRRKRGVRIMRKVWFATIEYMVVGLLWCIWAIVSTFQLVLGSVRTVDRVFRWLLWID